MAAQPLSEDREEKLLPKGSNKLARGNSKCTFPSHLLRDTWTLLKVILFYCPPAWDSLILHFKSTSLADVSSQDTRGKTVWRWWLQAEIFTCCLREADEVSTGISCSSGTTLCYSFLALPLAYAASSAGKSSLSSSFMLEDNGSCLLDRSCSEFLACSLTVTSLIQPFPSSDLIEEQEAYPCSRWWTAHWGALAWLPEAIYQVLLMQANRASTCSWRKSFWAWH